MPARLCPTPVASTSKGRPAAAALRRLPRLAAGASRRNPLLLTNPCPRRKPLPFAPGGGDASTDDRGSGAGSCLTGLAGGTLAQETKVAIGISGWTGFAPLTLAKEAGIFKKNGLDVTIKKIPQKDRHLAIASGDIQCAATTVETWIVVERQRRRHQADLPARQVLRRRRHGRAQRHRLDQGPQGQDGRGLRARHRALLHARLVPEEERPDGEGRDHRQPGAGGRPRRPSSPARTTRP